MKYLHLFLGKLKLLTNFAQICTCIFYIIILYVWVIMKLLISHYEVFQISHYEVINI